MKNNFSTYVSANNDGPLDPSKNNIATLYWFNLYFYTNYKGIMYAGNKDYQDFFYTYNDVKDIDGNLSVPKFNINGDGIGIFGAAVVDTVFFNVIK